MFKDKFLNWYSLLLLLVIGVLAWIFDTQYKFSGFPEVIVAWGTLVLASATYMLAKTTKQENDKLVNENKRIAEENQRTREEDREFDSKRRRLDEVQRWTEEVASLSIIGPSSDATQHVAVQERTDQLSTLLAKKEYVVLQAKRLDFDIDKLNLREEYEGTAESVVNRVSFLLDQWLRESIWGEPSSREEVKNRCMVLLKIISDLRAEFKL